MAHCDFHQQEHRQPHPSHWKPGDPYPSPAEMNRFIQLEARFSHITFIVTEISRHLYNMMDRANALFNPTITHFELFPFTHDDLHKASRADMRYWSGQTNQPPDFSTRGLPIMRVCYSVSGITGIISNQSYTLYFTHMDEDPRSHVPPPTDNFADLIWNDMKIEGATKSLVNQDTLLSTFNVAIISTETDEVEKGTSKNLAHDLPFNGNLMRNCFFIAYRISCLSSSSQAAVHNPTSFSNHQHTYPTNPPIPSTPPIKQTGQFGQIVQKAQIMCWIKQEFPTQPYPPAHPTHKPHPYQAQSHQPYPYHNRRSFPPGLQQSVMTTRK